MARGTDPAAVFIKHGFVAPPCLISASEFQPQNGKPGEQQRSARERCHGRNHAWCRGDSLTTRADRGMSGWSQRTLSAAWSGARPDRGTVPAAEVRTTWCKEEGQLGSQAYARDLQDRPRSRPQHDDPRVMISDGNVEMRLTFKGCRADRRAARAVADDLMVGLRPDGGRSH